MKAWKHLIPILFPVILIVLLGIGAIVLPDHTFSTAEMRYLRQFPSWSWEKAVTGEYSIQMEEYAYYRQVRNKMRLPEKYSRKRRCIFGGAAAFVKNCGELSPEFRGFWPP